MPNRRDSFPGRTKFTDLKPLRKRLRAFAPPAVGKVRPRISQHAFERAQERYGLTIKASEIPELAELCDKAWEAVAHAKLKRKIAQPDTRIFIAFHGRTMRLVYNPTRREIITFLPWPTDAPYQKPP